MSAPAPAASAVVVKALDLSAAHYDQSLLRSSSPSSSPSYFYRIPFHRQEADGFNNDIFGWRDGGNGTCYVPMVSEDCPPPLLALNNIVCGKATNDEDKVSQQEVPTTAAAFVSLADLEEYISLAASQQCQTQLPIASLLSPSNSSRAKDNSLVIVACGKTAADNEALGPSSSKFLSQVDVDRVHRIILTLRNMRHEGSFSFHASVRGIVLGVIEVPTNLMYGVGSNSSCCASQSCSLLIAPLKIALPQDSPIADHSLRQSIVPTPSRIVLFTNAKIKEIVADVTHTVTKDSPFYPGGQELLGCPASAARLNGRKLQLEQMAKQKEDAQTFSETLPTDDGPLRECSVVCGCDVGTHIDSPQHFFADPLHKSLTQLSVSDDLVLPVVMIDVRDQCAHDADYAVTVADIEAVVERRGRASLSGALVVAFTGWCSKFEEASKKGRPEIYQGKENKPTEEPVEDNVVGTKSKETTVSSNAMHFPGFSKEAALYLVEQNVAAIGIDTLSLDCGTSEDFIVHQIMLGSNRYQIENLNLTFMSTSTCTNPVPIANCEADSAPSTANPWWAIVLPIAAEGAFEGMGRVSFVRFELENIG